MPLDLPPFTFDFREQRHIIRFHWPYFPPTPLSRRGPEPPTFPALLNLLIAAYSHSTTTPLLGKEHREHSLIGTRKTQYNLCLLEDLVNQLMFALNPSSLDVPSFRPRFL